MSFTRIPVKNSPNLFKRSDNGVYYFRVFKKGFGRIEKSTGTDVLARAKVVADALRAELLNETPEERQQKRIVIEEWADFLKLQKNKAPNTYASKEIQGRVHLMPFFGQYFPSEINEVLWEKFISKYRGADPDDQSINRNRKFFNDRKYFNEFLNQLHKQGKIRRRPELRDPDPERDPGKVYSSDEIKRLLEAARKIRPARSKRTLINADDLYLQILCALTMGMRLWEILSLEWWQVDMTERVIFLPAHKVKIRKARRFPISEEVLPLLKARAKPDGPVFPSPTNPDKTVSRSGNKSAWTACRRLAGVQGRFHWLRHTFLTNAFRQPGNNAAFICFYAGLTLEEAEKTYLHFNMEDIRSVGSMVSLQTLGIQIEPKKNEMGKSQITGEKVGK